MRQLLMLLSFIIVAPLCAFVDSTKPYAFPNPYWVEKGKKVQIVIPRKWWGKVRVAVYAQDGTFVAQLRQKSEQKKGSAFIWDGKSFEGKNVVSGVYFVYVMLTQENRGVQAFQLLLYR